jgi:hypothetical protein
LGDEKYRRNFSDRVSGWDCLENIVVIKRSVIPEICTELCSVYSPVATSCENVRLDKLWVMTVG